MPPTDLRQLEFDVWARIGSNPFSGAFSRTPPIWFASRRGEERPTLLPRNEPFHFAGTAVFDLNGTIYRQS
jgi:hypothetical protein